MKRRTGLVLFLLSALLIGAGYAACFLPGGPPPWAPWIFALGTGTILIAAMMIGALPEDGRRGARLAVPLAITWIIVVGGFAAALLLPPETMRDGLWLGLPRRAAIILYGVGLLPMFVLPVAYALTFDDLTLRAEDVQRVRDAAERMRAAR
jgi:hypothetical protein